eukprot:GDKI01041523.1.p1 GENE.GDKI01041523.1~~GDKI01041523.1.p1  ORF type:complete len:293 (-),score=51.07 GDKI01041523.1:20-898(-)
MLLTSLPECLAHSFRYLDLPSLGLVCSTHRQLIQPGEDPTLWREVMKEHPAFSFPDFSFVGLLLLHPKQIAKLLGILCMALAAYERREFLRAVRLYDRALKVAPDSETALTRKGDALYALHADGLCVCGCSPNGTTCVHVHRAMACYKRAVELNPLSSHAWHGLSFEPDIDTAECERRLKRAIECNPHNSYALETYGDMLATSRAEDAVSMLETALSHNPKLFKARKALASAYLYTNQVEQSIRILNEQHVLWPDDTDEMRSLEFRAVMQQISLSRFAELRREIRERARSEI